MKAQAVLMSSARTGTGRDEWETPQHLLDRVRRIAPIDLDPCTSEANPAAARHFATEATSILDSVRWPGSGLIFVNPPYSQLRRWQLAARARRGKRELVMLVPARTDTRAWHEMVNDATAVAFLRGRLAFVDPETGLPGQAAPFPSAVIYWGCDARAFRLAFEDTAWVVDGPRG